MNRVGQIGPLPAHGGWGNNRVTSKWKLDSRSIGLIESLIERGVNGECAYVDAIPGRSKDIFNDARSAREAINSQIKGFARMGFPGWENVTAWQREIKEDKCVYIVVEYNENPVVKKQKMRVK